MQKFKIGDWVKIKENADESGDGRRFRGVVFQIDFIGKSPSGPYASGDYGKSLEMRGGIYMIELEKASPIEAVTYKLKQHATV